MKLWEWIWVQKLLDWCRKWEWFDKNVWGNSTSYEDAIRNPCEVLFTTQPPFIIKNVKSICVFNIRCAYKSALNNPDVPNCKLIPMGDKRKIIIEGKEWVVADLRIWNKWCTKFANAGFFFQFVCSLWKYIPIPYISLHAKIAPWYFQFAIGHAPSLNPDGSYSAILHGKFRFVNEVKSNEAILNPSDVMGYYEGIN